MVMDYVEKFQMIFFGGIWSFLKNTHNMNMKHA